MSGNANFICYFSITWKRTLVSATSFESKSNSLFGKRSCSFC